ncbi:MAG: threonine synthase [Acidimicrobiales bacterium]
MRYVSTRGLAPTLEFGDVLLAGLASDGGLYVPEFWPQFSLEDFVASHGPDADYESLATEVIWPFVADTITKDDFEAIVREAYSTFDHPDVVPLRELGDGVHLLELFHGPTFAFKDVALQLVARLFEHELARRDASVTIVAATSGDTGSAAIEAIRGREAMDIFVLHPYGRTSELQRRQMTTVGAPNVHNVAIRGTFDDCQDLVKAMFADQAFRDQVSMSAVNSINWSRVMAQIVYYWWAVLQLDRIGQPVAFSVPTGNFGNVFAGYCARRMGLDVAQFVIGSNRNDILTRFLDTGDMRIAEVEPSLSPSMDIQVSSNLERLLFEIHGRDGQAIAELMTTFREEGAVSMDPYRLGALRETWDGYRIDDAQTLSVIRDIDSRFGQVVDPHTAVGLGAAQHRARFGSIPMVVLATAHPAKFPEAIAEAIGRSPEVPQRLADVASKSEHLDVLDNDLAVVKAYIAERTRV